MVNLLVATAADADDDEGMGPPRALSVLIFANFSWYSWTIRLCSDLVLLLQKVRSTSGGLAKSDRCSLRLMKVPEEST